MSLSRPIAILVLLTIAAVAMIVMIIRTEPRDCVTIVRQYERAERAFAQQSDAVRERYARCKKGSQP